MKTVSVAASKSYQVHIGENLLQELGQYALSVKKACKVAIISDSNVWPLYGQQAETSLNHSGFQATHYVFPAGEASKSGATYLEILNFLAVEQLTRTDLLIALGGGVVGDMTGFVAATYLRGISFIQVPTTLLAMVDSSVGGKTAIDLPSGKNLAGAFYQPELVLCDLCTLSTLPMDVFRDGCAEVIKYGILYDPILFDHLEAHSVGFKREYVISRCVELKRDVVAEDEFDRGNRQKLNLGHTIGHGIEACSNYATSHGYAVAAGTGIIARSSVKLGYCQHNDCQRILSTLTSFGLPTTTTYEAITLHEKTLSDKKRQADIVNLIIPERIGACSIRPFPVNELLQIIESGL